MVITLQERLCQLIELQRHHGRASLSSHEREKKHLGWVLGGVKQ
jgi:hypothetical protein